MTRVLFVCVQNAGRSQLAQALYERRGGEARSAGSQPADEIHPVVAEALEEIGVDVSQRRPKALTRDDCLDEVRELRGEIERRVAELP